MQSRENQVCLRISLPGDSEFHVCSPRACTDHRGLRLEIAPTTIIRGSHDTTPSNSIIERRKVLSDLLGFPAQSVVEFATRFNGYIPERQEGDLLRILEQFLDLPTANALPALFALMAYSATNNALNNSKMDEFLKWVIEHQHLNFLQQFMALQLPTIHAFAKYVFESAIRIKSVPVLSELLDLGVDFGSVAQDIVSIGDNALTRRVLMKMDPKYFKKDAGGRLFHRFVSAGLFDLAKILLDNGVSVDVRNSSGEGDTALFQAACYDEIERVQFLTEAGADILASSAPRWYDAENGNNPLARATCRGRADFVALMLKHNPNRGLTGRIQGKPIIQWASIHCKRICELLLNHAATESPAVLLGDLLDAAVMGGQEWTDYVQKHSNGLSHYLLEQVLEQCIKSRHFAAVVTLLVHGVDPNGPTLTTSPIKTALKLKRVEYVELLLRHKVKMTESGLLDLAVRFPDISALRILLPHCTDPRERMEALVTVINLGSGDKITHAHAQILLRSGVNIDTPGLRLNPLQSAANTGDAKMVSFLLQRGASVNAAAFDCGGRTALQAALEGENPIKMARILLRKRADILAPPAMVEGRTALEAFCHSYSAMDDSRSESFFNELLDAAAEVNRPDGEPSLVLHGVISRGWHNTLARCLEPQYHTIADHMWRDEEYSQSEPDQYKPLTPTQLAVSEGDMEALKLLLDYGTDVNELPGDEFGRTALQAACEREIGPAKTELINFLLDRGANVNAEAGLECGVTALQAAAITGDIKIVELLISKGADVNAMASFEEGRYAIEGAAEHGRLDTVKMLLNAGAKGNLQLGTGFEYAIELAEGNGHFVVANLLKTEGPDYLAMSV